MHLIKKILVCSLMVLTFVFTSLPVNAATGTVYVSAGGSAFTSEYTQSYGSNSQCHMSLTYVHFSNYAENTIPCTYYVYSRLYLRSNHNTQVSHLASFSQVSDSGYNYDYYNGYATNGQQFVLKSNSNLDIYYSATFAFSAWPW